MPASPVVLGAALKTASATASPGMPAGTLEVDDVLVMWANVSSGTISISANSTGWVLLDHSTTAATNACEGYLWIMRVTSAGMTGPELTRTAGDYMIARIARIRGVDERGTINDALLGEHYTNSGAGVFTLSHTTFNTTADDALILFIGQCGLDAAGTDVTVNGIDRSGSSLDWVAPYQNETGDGTTTGNGGGYAFCFGYKATAGATGQLDWTHGTARGWIKQSFALRGRVRDRTAPVITATAASGSTIASTDSVQIDSTDAHAGGYGGVALAQLNVIAIYSDGTSENVYSSSAFGAKYTNGTNVASSITNGTRLVVKHDGTGWPTTTMTLRVTATDNFGNKTISDLAYTVTGFFVASSPAIPAYSPVPGAIANAATVTVDATDADDDLQRIIVSIVRADGFTELVYDGLASGFVAPYAASSTVTPITHGYRLVLARTDGWETASFTLNVRAIDAGARENTRTGDFTTDYTVNAPTVSAFSPVAGAIGEAATITVDVTDADDDLQRIVVYAVRNDGRTELIYDGLASGFKAPYVADSTVTGIALGYRLVIDPGTTWGCSAFTLHVVSYDGAARETVVTGDYTTDYTETAPTIGSWTHSALATVSETQAIGFHVTDADNNLARVTIWVIRATQNTPARSEMAFDGKTGGFESNYSAFSTNDAISNGRDFSIKRTHGAGAGWEDSDFTIHVKAVDTLGNTTETSRQFFTGYSETAPTIAAYSPAPGLISETQAITIDVTDNDANLKRIVVYAERDDGTTELVHDGETSGFESPYAATSTNTVISGGRRLVVRRTGGWEAASFVLRTLAYDDGALEDTRSGSYTTPYTETAPVITATTPEGAIDLDDAIEINVTDADDNLEITTIFATYGSDFGSITETVYDGTDFTGPFVVGSTTDDADFSCVRAGGWPSADVVITVVAVDDKGNKTTEVFVYTTNFIYVPPDTEAPVLSNFEPSDFIIRKMTVIEFDVTDNHTLTYTGISAVYDDIGEDEVVFDGFEFGEHYQSSINQRTVISGGYHFKILRDDGWKNAPQIKPVMIDAGGNTAEA